MFLVWSTKFEKYFEFYAKLICCLKKREIVWNLNFWENWVLNLGFVKIISPHTHAFFFIILQCFEERLLKILLIFKNSFFFYNFDRSSLFFDQSKLCLKISVSLCLVRLIEPVFRSIEHRESSFFLNTVFDLFKTLFQTFLSLSDLARLHWGFFVVFNQIFCKVFLSQGR